MSWIKRNLYFLIGALVALVLMGFSGWYLFSKYELNNQWIDKLNQAYKNLEDFNAQKLRPGSGQVDNVALAKEQQQQLRSYIQNVRKFFQPILAIPAPEGTNK